MLPAACLESFSDDDDNDWWPCKLNCNWESGLLYVVAIPPSLPTRGPVDSSSNNNNNKSHAQTWTSSRSSSRSVLSRACVWPKNGTKVVASFCFWFKKKMERKENVVGFALIIIIMVAWRPDWLLGTVWPSSPTRYGQQLQSTPNTYVKSRREEFENRLDMRSSWIRSTDSFRFLIM